MILFNNVLKEENIQSLITLVDYEVKNFPCLTEEVPRHQSFNNMHKKYYYNNSFFDLLNFTTQKTKKFINGNCSISGCWFNIIDENSNILGEEGLHCHPNLIAAVYYLKNCKKNGTVLNINGVNLQAMVDDNSLLIFNGDISHTVNKYDNSIRYSIAFDFIRH